MKGNTMSRHRIKKVPSSILLVFLAIAGCIYKLCSEYSQQKMRERTVSQAKIEAKQMEPAMLIDKRWGEKIGYLFLDDDKNSNTTEGIVTVKNLSNPNQLALMRDLTNGTVKTVQEWKQIGFYYDVRQ